MTIACQDFLADLDILDSSEDGKDGRSILIASEVLIWPCDRNQPKFGIKMCLAASVVSELTQPVLALNHVFARQDLPFFLSESEVPFVRLSASLVACQPLV